MTNKPRYIVVHSSDVSYRANPDQFFAIERYHASRGFPESSLGWHGGYHILVSNGREYRYREDWEEGAHCNAKVDGISMNLQSLGTCWAGDGDVEFPTPEDTALVKARIEKWMAKYGIPIENVGPHRRWTPAKTCYGSLLPDDWVQRLFAPLAPGPEKAEKQAEIARLQSIVDILRLIVLRLMILIGLQTRQRVPPPEERSSEGVI